MKDWGGNLAWTLDKKLLNQWKKNGEKKPKLEHFAEYRCYKLNKKPLNIEK